jgi:hypothetical protein
MALIGLAVLETGSHAANAVGEATHLGGAMVGYLPIRNLHWFSAIGLARRRHNFWTPGDPSPNFSCLDA